MLYEYPFNEHIRTLLRLEKLFERVPYFIQQGHSFDHHAALVCLFDIMEVAARSDLKTDLLQELEKQRQSLDNLRNNPNIAKRALEALLIELNEVAQNLGRVCGKFGDHLKESDWLMSIRGRTQIPGGANEFDLPTYHAWLHQDQKTRTQDLNAWAEPFIPLHQSVSMVLRLIRQTQQKEHVIAEHGMYQQVTTSKPCALVQIVMPEESPYIPEVTANKYRLSVRFVTQGENFRPRPVSDRVDFDLHLCALPGHS